MRQGRANKAFHNPSAHCCITCRSSHTHPTSLIHVPRNGPHPKHRPAKHAQLAAKGGAEVGRECDAHGVRLARTVAPAPAVRWAVHCLAAVHVWHVWCCGKAAERVACAPRIHAHSEPRLVALPHLRLVLVASGGGAGAGNGVSEALGEGRGEVGEEAGRGADRRGGLGAAAASNTSSFHGCCCPPTCSWLLCIGVPAALPALPSCAWDLLCVRCCCCSRLGSGQAPCCCSRCCARARAAEGLQQLHMSGRGIKSTPGSAAGAGPVGRVVVVVVVVWWA